jgi:hypothetical protein
VPPDLRWFVERSLTALEREAPAFHAQLCSTLRGRRVRITGDGDPFALRFDAGTVTNTEPDGSEDVLLSVGNQALLELVDGQLSIEEALRQDRLEMRGQLRGVVDVFDALVIYVRGAIRCPACPPLLSEFRAATLFQNEVSR